MASIIACPHGITLPYSSLFNVTLRKQSGRPVKSRPATYFWNQATKDSLAQVSPQAEVPQDELWLDSGEPAFSDSEDESSLAQKKVNQNVKIPRSRLTKLRRIAFKAFDYNSDSIHRKNNIVRSTEIISRQEIFNNPSQNGTTAKGTKRTSIFRSWKFKSRGDSKAQVHKMVAVLKERISAASPFEKHPKTWDEYDRAYAEEQIDVLNPPLPPMEPRPEAFESRFYKAPEPTNEKVRQLVVNRLGILGGKPFDATDEGAARSKVRVEIGDKLIEEGKAPATLADYWERSDSVNSNTSDATLTPETLEQHPVFRNIVKQCRELFGTALSMLSVFDDDRQLFLAESGLGGLRDISRDIGFCAHTILSGRKGFTILDTHKDWRFENGPLVQKKGTRFYAGVPLMAPNLDGSPEAEANACPIGTLCVADMNPRESFSVEDRKKLVYMSEYARREIENWFAKKMDIKMDHLRENQEIWNEEMKNMGNDEKHSPESEVLSDGRTTSNSHTSSHRRCLTRIQSSNTISTAPTSPSSHMNTPMKSPTKTSAVQSEVPNLTVSPKTQKVFDLATRLVAETLDLPLVYLAAIVSDTGLKETSRTTILSGHNIPLPTPVFDTGLHLRVLSTPEGGLLYQNPNLEESTAAGFQPKILQSEASNPYASAILLAVEAEAHSNYIGFVLAGYTDDRKRVFGEEDVTYMKQFAQELSRCISRSSL